jgi:hypothetical protein
MKPASRTRVKICGITRIDDALAAANAGADAIGLVFWPGTPRKVEFEQARAIAAAVPAFVTIVGLFVDPQPAAVRSALDAVALDVLQFHGDEPQSLCASFARPYIKAVPVRPEVDLLQYASRYRDARACCSTRSSPAGCRAVPGGPSTGRRWRRGSTRTRATADSVRRAHAAQRRRRDPRIAAVGGRRIERRRDDRRRRQTAQRHQGPGEDRRVHPRSA